MLSPNSESSGYIKGKPVSAVLDTENSKPPRHSPIWWPNSIFFVGTHVLATYGVLYVSPWKNISIYSLFLAFASYRLSMLGITLGYHRLYSHRAFKATMIVRVMVAIFGSMACQGSIKWWCLRHRLHHRFTDDPDHDPYAASKGLLFSHVGWIFFKPTYEKLNSVEKNDLENDPVVRIQHKYYLEAAIFFGFVFPAILGLTWGDARGSFIWAGLVARVFTWHSTFIVNSLAHWEGLQRFSDETSAKGNLVMALFTCGEGNHNFHHAFPYDYRAGPALTDWDPCKWIISSLSYFKLASHVRRADTEEIQYALEYMKEKQQNLSNQGAINSYPVHEGQVQRWEGPVWSRAKAQSHMGAAPKECCFLMVDDYLIDVTQYMREHPGGARIFRPYSIRVRNEEIIWQDATWAFQNHNRHSLMARRRLRQLAIAKVLEQADKEQ